jgi:hypothetical protein
VKRLLKFIESVPKGGMKMFLGISDISILAVYFLCILSTLACVVYGLYNWNRGGEEDVQELKEKTE